MTALKGCVTVPCPALLWLCQRRAPAQRDRSRRYARSAQSRRRRLHLSAGVLEDPTGRAKADSTPDKPILGRSAEALTAWLKAADIREGAIFRHIWKDRVGPALLPGSVASIVKRRARVAGLEGDFGAHSLRSGFVTEAGKQGVPLPAVMAMTEHRSVASVIGYFQAGAVEVNPAARLLK